MTDFRRTVSRVRNLIRRSRHTAAVCAGFGLLAAASTFAAEPLKVPVPAPRDAETWAIQIRPANRTAQAEPSRPLIADPQPNTPVPQDGTTYNAPSREPLPPAPQLLPNRSAASESYEKHGITVTPGGRKTLDVFGRSYEAAYNSVTYRKSEYQANPSYRHEAAMEILFGQMRPTTVVKQQAAADSLPQQSEPMDRYSPSAGDFWNYREPLGPYLIEREGCAFPPACGFPTY